MVRKWAILVVILGVSVGLTACGSSSKKSAASGSTTTVAGGTTTTAAGTAQVLCDGKTPYDQQIGQPSDFKPIKADTLSVVTSLPGPGFWEGSDTDPTKLTSGYEYDIAKELQQAFGLGKLSVRNVSFDALVAGTVTDFDIALSQVTINCKRAAVVNFTRPYFQSNQGVLTKADFSKPLTTVADAKKIRWGAQTGTTALDLLDKIKPDTRTLVYPQLSDAYTALQAGQVEAVLIDTAINLGQAARSKGALKVPAQFAQPGGPDQYGALLPKDSTNAAAINGVFKSLEDSGKLNQLVEKDLGVNLATLPTIKVINVP
jgi:polar amino acid transport system substrate-binding protein